MLKQAKVGGSDNRINYSGELHYLISSTTWELCTRAGNEPSQSFPITEKAPFRAFSWLKMLTSTFIFKTLLMHYVKQMLAGDK